MRIQIGMQSRIRIGIWIGMQIRIQIWIRIGITIRMMIRKTMKVRARGGVNEKNGADLSHPSLQCTKTGVPAARACAVSRAPCRT